MERTLKWGLIGCGDIARKRVAPALRELDSAEFVAVARARAERAGAFAREFGARRACAHWRDLVEAPDIEAVYVATPVHLHAEQAVAAAEAGKHVLCEKPMALDLEQCERMIDACASAGVRLGVAYYRRFYPILGRIREVLASGEVGRPVLVRIDAFERWNVPPDHPRAWFLKKDLAGGGPMFDFGCHRIEVLLHLFGPIRRTRASLGRLLYVREVEDTATALFDFENAVQGVLAVTHAAFESRDTLEVFASEGSLHVPVLNEGTLRIRTARGERSEDFPPHPNLHLPLIEDFTRAVLEGREPAVGGATGLEVNRALERIFSD
jgi:predicted dehydrogenase